MDRILGYDPEDVSSSLTIPTIMIHGVMVAYLTLTQMVQVQILMDHQFENLKRKVMTRKAQILSLSLLSSCLLKT